MTSWTRIIRNFLLVAVLVVLTATPATQAYLQSPGAYVCPPCGTACHHLKFDAPGSCPVCGMPLVRRDSITTAAILLFPGVQIIDYSGPYEVFGQAGIQVYTVAEKAGPLTTAMGLSVNPGYTFENLPPVDIVVVPGGHIEAVTSSPAALDWIKREAGSADYVLSVCNGAFALADAGLLDGLKATTFHRLIGALRDAAPKATVVSDQRYVDNGKIITSAGLSSGIDASLHLLSRLYGKGRAQSVALNLEYDWRPESGFARADLADRLLQGVQPQPPAGSRVTLESTEGNRDGWTKVWTVQSADSAEQLLTRFRELLEQREGWATSTHTGPTRRAWIVKDGKARWQATVSVEKASSDQLQVTLRIKRLTSP